MNYRRVTNLLLTTLSLAVPVALAQTSPSTSKEQVDPGMTQASVAPGRYSLQVKTQLVVLDVVVNNEKGEPVSGLTRDDFKIYENKVPQMIVSIDQAHAPATPLPAIHSTAELDKLEPNAPVSIIVLDEVTSLFDDQAFARYSLKRYLNSESDMLPQPTMLVATGLNDMMVLHDYTTSKKELLDALDRHFATNNWQAAAGNWKSEQFGATFASLMAVAEATAGHPGHKNMIWVGRGFPGFQWEKLQPDTAASMQSLIATCTNLLRDARVTLYNVDPAGVAAMSPPTDEQGFMDVDPFGGEVTFDAMAKASGGQAFHGRNDVDHLIETAVRDGLTFYTISYKPTEVSQDPKEFRHIDVLMAKPGLRASTREGYFAAAAPVPEPAEEAGKASARTVFDLGVAAQSVMVYDGLPLTIRRDAATPDHLTVRLPAALLAWETEDSLKKRTYLTMLVETFDRKGKSLYRKGTGLTVELPVSGGDITENRMVTLTATVPTAAPAARIRIAVRSDGNGKLGADNVFLIDRNKLSDPAMGLSPQRTSH